MLNNFYPDDPNRVGCPSDSCVSDNIKIAPYSELLAILDCEIIFWECYGIEGIKLPYPMARNDAEHIRNRLTVQSFEDTLRLGLATQDYSLIGELVASQMTEYADGIWQKNNEDE